MNATPGAGDSPYPTPLEVVRAVYVSHENRDTPGLMDLLADDVEWHQAQGHPYAGERPWRGAAEVVRHVVNPINEDWDDYRTSIDEYFDAGDCIIVLGRYRGVYKTTGREVDAPVCTIYRVRGGRIWRWQQFTDTAQFRYAMNLPLEEEIT